MKNTLNRLRHISDNVCKTDKGVSPAFNKLTAVGLISIIFFIAFVNVILGFNRVVMITAIVPIIGFLLAFYLNYKKKFGQGLLIILIVSLFHESIVVYTYDYQFLEIMYIFIAIVPLFPFDNLKLLRTFYLLSYLGFLLVGFHFRQYDLFEIFQWPKSILVYFILMNITFIVLYQFLIAYKKNSLKNRNEILKQNELIKLNTKMIIQFEHEKHELEIANKQKDMELLNLNNQLKIKMKNDLIKDLQKIKKSNTDKNTSIQSVITKLKHQIDEESKIDLLQKNIDEVGSDFNKRILQQFPNLSKTEIELLSFIKLKLSNKQIAIQRNTSPNSVNVILHRLKQKCNFESTNDLKKYIESF